MKKATIKVEIKPIHDPKKPVTTAEKYALEIRYVEDNITFRCDDNGSGFDLPTATHYAFVMHDHIKED